MVLSNNAETNVNIDEQMKKEMDVTDPRYLLKGYKNNPEIEPSDQKLISEKPFEVFKYFKLQSYQDKRYPLILTLFENGFVLFDGSLNPYVKGTNKNSGYNYIGNYQQNILLKNNLIRNRKLFKNGKLIEGWEQERETIGIDWKPGNTSNHKEYKTRNETPSIEELKKMKPKEIFKIFGLTSYNNDRYPLILTLFEKGFVLFDGSLNPYVKGTNKNSGYNYIGNYQQNLKLKRNLIHNRKLIQDGKLVKGWENKWKTQE